MKQILLILSFSIALFASDTVKTQTNTNDGIATKAVNKASAREEKLAKRALKREEKTKKREAKLNNLHNRLEAEDSEDTCE